MVEDGRPSERGHCGKYVPLVLLILPFVMVKHRRELYRYIRGE